MQWTAIAQDSGESEPYFDAASLVVAGALAAAIVAGARMPGVRARWTRLTRESRARRVTAALLAVAAVVVTVLPVINTDGAISRR